MPSSPEPREAAAGDRPAAGGHRTHLHRRSRLPVDARAATPVPDAAGGRRPRRWSLLLFALAYLSPYFVAWQYNELDTSAFLSPPSAEHWFGTTQNGFDMFALTMRGMQKSLIIGLLGALIATSLAAVVGSFAGYFGGRLNTMLLVLVDLLLVLPAFLIIAILSPAFRGRTWLLFVVLLSVFHWMVTSRIVRGMTLSLKEREFVQAARFMGVPGWRIIFRHILPNMSSLLIIDATVNVSALILAEVGPVVLRLRRAAAGRVARDAHRQLRQCGPHLPVAVLLSRPRRSSCSCCRSTWSATRCATRSIRTQPAGAPGEPSRLSTHRSVADPGRRRPRGHVPQRGRRRVGGARHLVSGAHRRGARHRRRIRVGQVRVVAGGHGPAAGERARDGIGPLSRARADRAERSRAVRHSRAGASR